MKQPFHIPFLLLVAKDEVYLEEERREMVCASVPRKGEKIRLFDRDPIEGELVEVLDVIYKPDFVTYWNQLHISVFVKRIPDPGMEADT